MNGLLFLGASEGLGNQSDYFEALDSRWKLYKKNLGGPVPIRAASVLTTANPLPFHDDRPTALNDSFVVSRRGKRLQQDYDRILERCGVSGFWLTKTAGRSIHSAKPIDIYDSARGVSMTTY